MKRSKRVLALGLLLALLLSLPCRAAAEEPDDAFSGKTFDEIMAAFMEENGLTEENFSMGWYNTGTGESWYFNADRFLPAGSMYKLPLNMEFERRLNEGLLSPDDLVGGYKVETAMYLSLVYSDNEVSQDMRYLLTQNRDEYRLILSQFSGLDESELPPEYFTDNGMSPRFVLNTLLYLYENRDSFPTVIGLMKQAHPDAYFRKDQGEYEIAHKYGSFEGMLNDCGIVFTPTPFLLVAFTKSVPEAELVLGSLCRMLTRYSLYLDEQAALAAEEEARLRAEEQARLEAQEEERLAREEAERRAQEALQALATPTPVPTPAPETETGDSALPLFFAIGGAALLLALGIVFAVSYRKRGKHSPAARK
ncbi:MAG: serine hydrolase [Oscillospiraceae bacterium]